MNQTFALAHLSDLHLFSLKGARLRELLNKRIFGYAAWRLRRHAEHRPKVLDALLDDLPAAGLDHIVVTGDLTHLSLSDEFRQAARLLRRLGSPWQVTVIPGNHDTYVPSRGGRALALWQEYMVSDEPSASKRNSRPVFPSLRRRGPIAFIGVSSAHPNNPLLAVGSIGQGQLQKLAQILAETGREGLFRVVLIHHPPVSGVVVARKRLTDAAAFRSVLARHGAELILHGHAHHRSLSQLTTPAGRVPVIGVPSATAVGRKPQRRACYHVYRITPHPPGWRVYLAVRGFSPAQERFVAEEGASRQMQIRSPHRPPGVGDEIESP
ncbi:MAG: metallophosphoesterase [Desulfobacterales bacterium]|nr:MAG: metallophosphoesterase [Desulfobacterales bacterium]